MTTPRRRMAGGTVPRDTLAALILLAAARAAGLVLIAEGIARLVVGADLALAATLAASGLAVRSAAAWGTGIAGRRAATQAKSAQRVTVARAVLDRDLDAGSVAVTATRGLDALDGYYTAVIPAAIAAIVVPVALGVRILVADPLSALILALTMPLVPVFMVLIGKHTRERVAGAYAALDRLADHVAELARGLPVLVGLGRDREQRDRLAAIQARHSGLARGVLRTAFLSSLALELVATLSVALVAVVLGIRLLSGDAALGEALLVLILAPECFAALRDLGTAHHAGQDARAVRDRIGTLLDSPPPVDPRTPGASLRVRGLQVRHPGRSHPAIERLDLEVGPGETIRLAGASGSGKSTVLAAVTGTLPVGAAVDGVVEVPRAVAWLPQAPRLCEATARAELQMVAGEAGHRVADAVLAELGLSALADAPIAELSPGETRRVALARALLRIDLGGELLVLDEPTAHLDADSAARVRAAIRRRRVATLLVTHDPDTAMLADRTVVLDDSRPASGRVPSTPVPGEAADPPRAVTPIPGVAAASIRTAVRSTLAVARGSWLGAILLGSASAAAALALAACSGWLIVKASEQPAIMYLLVAIVGVRFFGLARAGLRYAERLVTHRATFAATDALRLRLWSGITARGAGSRQLREGGTAVDLLVGTVGEVRDALARVVVPIGSGIVAAAGVVVAVAVLAPRALPIALAAVVVGLVVPAAATLLLGRRAERARVSSESGLLRRFAATGAAAADLRGNGCEHGAVERLTRAAGELGRLESQSARAADLASTLPPLVTGLGAVLAATILALSATPAEIVAPVVLLLLGVGEVLSSVTAGVHRIPALGAAFAVLAPVLAAPDRLRHGTAPVGEVNRLALDRLAVGFSPDIPVAAGLDGLAEPGRWLIVAGPSGSGKTTLLTTLLGDLDPVAGEILVGGTELRALDPTAWRSRIAWCPQEAHVFDSTLRANLAIGRPRTRQPDDDELRDVLERVGLGRLLRGAEAGLDARVGPGGRALSGGERQRLAVARALLSDARIVLLDEPTAHLDPPTAEHVLADLRAALADRVVVLVTHRAGDTRPEDRILRLGAVAGHERAA